MTLTVLTVMLIAFIHNLCHFFGEGGGVNTLAVRLLQLVLISIPLTVAITLYIIKNESHNCCKHPESQPTNPQPPSKPSMQDTAAQSDNNDNDYPGEPIE